MTLDEARNYAARLLNNPETTLSDLRSAADALGSALVSAAGDDDLWNRLTALPDGVDGAQWNLLLTTLEGVEWEQILLEPRTGYEPPPEPQARETAADIRAALAQGNDGQTDVGATREGVRELGLTLRTVAADPDSQRPTLRRWLGIGLRVAVPLTITVAISVALHPVLIPAVAAIGLHHVAAELAVACVDGVIHKTVDYVIDRFRRKRREHE